MCAPTGTLRPATRIQPSLISPAPRRGAQCAPASLRHIFGIHRKTSKLSTRAHNVRPYRLTPPEIETVKEKGSPMNIQFSTRICPEAECIFLLERRFRPGLDIQHNVDEVCHYLSEKYDIPLFELEPLLQPLAEVETYVNSNLAVQEDRLRFFFTARNGALNSLAWSLYNAMKRGSQYGAQTPQSVNLILCRFLDVPDDSLDHVTCTDELIQFLMKNGCTEDVKWVCTALYYSMDEYLEELDVILRKATGLFLEHLPDVTALCRQTAAYAETQIGDDPSRIFHNLNITTQSEVITVYPCLMGFHGLSWDFSDSHIYFGVYYELLTNLIQKYSDQSSSLVSRLKSIGDKSRLEILRSLKSGECNGQDISEKLGLAPATISHHMNLLTNEGFVTTTKRGTSTYYTLNSPTLRRFIQELDHCLL